MSPASRCDSERPSLKHNLSPIHAIAPMLAAFFVYGTLKRGQLRERMWPREPKSVQPAIVRGRLFGRDDYPAMKTGDDWVAGELWRFSPEDADAVTAALDQIEGTNQPGHPDLYYRIEVQSYTPQQHPLAIAFTYVYAGDPLRDGFVRIEPGTDQFTRWPTDR